MLNALGRFNISRYLFHEICFLNAHYYLLSQQITFYISVCRLTKKVHQEKKTKSVYVSTVISIALVLLMTGLLGLILVHAKNLSKYVKENIVLNIIVNENVNEGDVLAMQKDLEKDPYVLRTEYISKELAAKT